MNRPSLLIAYPFLKSFEENRADLLIRNWVLDSGAFSAFTSGRTIDLSRYIADCHRLLCSASPPEIIFSLDVIGDPEASLRNHERMMVNDVPAVPTFHRGAASHYLEDMARCHSRIAIGGLALRGKDGHGTRVQIKDKLKFVEQCLARVWPKWVHGFGCVDRRILERFPLASADSTTWLYAVARYGASSMLGHQRVPRNNKVLVPTFIRAEIRFFLDVEKQARDRFGRIMANVGLPEFSVRLSCGPQDFKWFKGEDID